jgi:serine/threonine protein kinase
MVMEFASLGSLYAYLNNNMTWKERITALLDISIGLNTLHNNDLIHQDFHPGNLLFNNQKALLITDFGLCNQTNQSSQSNDIYGVMPYVAPEVLKGKPYTKAADIYSFGMIMYFIATGGQPFANCAHDEFLAIRICNGNRPEINEQEVPECYIDLMKKCWNSDPNNRPSISKIERSIREFYNSIIDGRSNEINKQFNEAEKYRKANLLIVENNQPIIHPQAIYTSRLLNPFTKDLSKYDSLVIDFTK